MAAWHRPAFAYGLCMALAVGQLGRSSGELLPGIPSTLWVTMAFLTLALLQRRWTHAWSAWRACAAAFWSYAFVCLIEGLSVPFRGGMAYLPFALGRWAFLAMCVTTAAMVEDLDALRDVLAGNAYASGIIGLLTVLHTTGIVHVPFGLDLMPARSFGPIHMPFPRTLGVTMSPDKFAIIAALAVLSIGLTSHGPRPIVRPRWVALLLALLTLLACLVTQTRAVYLGIVFALVLTVFFRLPERSRATSRLGMAGPERSRATSRLGMAGPERLLRSCFSMATGAWAAVLLFALALVMANVVFAHSPPDALLETGTSAGARNIEIRIQANAQALQFLRRWPWLGIGHGEFEALTNEDNGVHNHFLEQMVATGLLGGLPYWLFHALILVATLRACGDDRPELGGLGCVLAGATAVTFLMYQFFPGYLTTPFAVVCGLVAALARQHKRAEA